MLFNWVSRCWGGMGINTRFEKARINCCIADWTVPYENDILVLITSFQDKNPEIPAKTAINTFLSHLQTDEQKSHPAFLLKHLYVLDHCVQEMTALDTIGYYYNSNLTATKSFHNIQFNENRSPLRQLINTYYSYLITKARCFSHYENSYFSKDFRTNSFQLLINSSLNKVYPKTAENHSFQSQVTAKDLPSTSSVFTSSRKKKTRQCTREQKFIEEMFQKQSSYNSVFDVIEKCQQVQQCINEMNRSYLSGNKKAELIKYIFIMCLRTYIRCYIIVSIGIRFLFKQFMSMSLKQLERFIKAFLHFNNEYTGDFIRFVESSKNDIEIFKEINYNELTYVNRDDIRILLEYKDELKTKQSVRKLASSSVLESPSILNNPNSFYLSIADEIKEMKILQLPHDVHVKLKENMKIFYKPRKDMHFCLLRSSQKKLVEPYIYADNFDEQRMDESFFKYVNFYHQDFIIKSDETLQSSTLKQTRSDPNGSPLKISQQIVKQIDESKSNKALEPQYEIVVTQSEVKSPSKQQKHKNSSHLSDGDESLKLVNELTSHILKAHHSNRSITPIKESEMSQIKEMFHHRGKKSRKYSTWEEYQTETKDLTQNKI